MVTGVCRNRLYGFSILSVLWSGFALPCFATQTLTDPDGYLYDAYEGTVNLVNGSSDAYDGAYYLKINGTTYSSSTLTVQGRNIVGQVHVISGLEVTRKLYVPAAKTGALGNFGRWYDALHNPTASPVTVTVEYTGNLGSDSYTVITGTSDGDTVVETTDTWIATDDSSNGGGDPSLAHVMDAEGAEETIDQVSFSSDAFSWRYNDVTVQPGETKAFLTYAVQDVNRSSSHQEAEGIVTSLMTGDLNSVALYGLSSDEFQYVVNTKSKALSVGPGLFIAYGDVGGPFSPSQQDYLITNNGESSFTWSASTTASWLDLDTAGGTLDPGASATLEASINSLADALPLGIYQEEILFENSTDGESVSTDVTLYVGRGILVYTQYTNKASNEYLNVMSALDVAGIDYNLTELTSYTMLETLLPGHAVLLIPEQMNASNSQLQTIGQQWSAILQDFVSAGGAVVQCDGNGRYDILTGAGLLEITASFDCEYQTVHVVAPGDALAQGVASSFYAEYDSRAYQTLEAGVVVEAAAGAMVINKGLGLGNVVLIGNDYYYSTNNDLNKILTNAVFNLPDDKGCLGLTPSLHFASYGPAGGPFEPPAQTYTITNLCQAACTWTVETEADWLEFSTSGGPLNPGESLAIEVGISTNADFLTPGSYSEEIVFTNTTTGAVQKRQATLYVDPVKILAFTQYTNTREYAGTIAAIRSVSENYVMDKLTDYSQLSSKLPGHDLLLIPEQNAGQSTLEMIGGTWGITLHDFAAAGGVIVHCDGQGYYQILTSAGLLEIISHYDSSYQTATVIAPDDPLAQGVSSGFEAAYDSQSYQTLEADVVVEASGGALVINKGLGLGNIALIGNDYYYTDNEDLNQILANAVFNLPDEKDCLELTPSVHSVFYGDIGGPFEPLSVEYTLHNQCLSAFDWTVGTDASWLDLSTTGGTLSGGESTAVQISVNSNADSLPAGSYVEPVTFTNEMTGAIQVRTITLKTGYKKILAYTQYANTREYNNLLGVLSQKSDNYAVTELDDYTQLDSLLPEHDLLLIPEQYTAQSTLESIGEVWSTALRDFAAAGGVVIQSDGNGGCGILTGADLLDVTESYDCEYQTVNVTAPEDPLVQDVASSFYAAYDSRAYQTREAGVVVEAATGAMIINKSLGLGNVVLIGNDYYYTTSEDLNQILANAVFLLPDDKDCLGLSPSFNFASYGPEGGPFDPSCQSYTITNLCESAYTWIVHTAADWLQISASGGVLDPGESFLVDVCLSNDANQLPPGLYSEELVFTNTTTGASRTRTATLYVDPVRILAYTQYMNAREYAGTLAGIRVMSKNFVVDSLTDSAQLNSQLPGHDVLLIPDQSTDQSTLEPIGASWTVPLNNFVTAGGTVIQCDGYGRYGILTGAGLMSISGSAECQYQTITVTDPDDPLVQGVSPTYSAEYASMSYITSETDIAATADTGAVLINKKTGLGNVVLIGHDYYYSNADQDRIIGNAVFNLDNLAVIPAEDFYASGNQGGPFAPAQKVYTLKNLGSLPLNWTAQTSSSWVALSQSAGTLNAHSQGTVTVSLEAITETFPQGTYRDTLIFRNLTSGAVFRREIALVILPTGMLFYDDFPSTALNSANWPNTLGLPTIDRDGIAECSEPYSLRMNANDLVQSRVLDLSGAAFGQVFLQYGYEQTGGGNPPESWDTLVFSYWDGLNWNELLQYYGENENMTEFEVVNLPLPAAALHASFMLRISTGGYSDQYDDWFIDDVSLLKYSLQVTPYEDLESLGYEGGPFTPAGLDYSLYNNSPSPIEWEVQTSVNWLSVLPEDEGILNPGDPAVAVTIELDEDADLLPAGVHTGVISFIDHTNGLTQTHTVTVTIKSIPGEILVTDTLEDPYDLYMPYGTRIIGLPATEQILITNEDTRYNLVLTDISTKFLEDFEDGLAQDWLEDVDQNWEVLDGEYRAKTAGTDGMVSRYIGAEWADLAVQTVTHRDGDTSYSGRLFLRATQNFDENNGSAYVFQVTTNGYYSIYKQVNGIWSWMQSWTNSPVIKPDTNILTASAEGNQLKYFINNTLIWTGTDEDLTEGYIGVGGYTSAGSTTHYFDDVMVDDPISETDDLSEEQTWYNERAYEGGEPGQAPQNWSVPEYPGGSDVQNPVKQSLLTKKTFSLGQELEFPITLGPGEQLAVDVIFDPSAPGDYESKVTIKSNDDDEPVTEVALAGSAIPDYLAVTPETSQVRLFLGHPGGPFVPSQLVYEVTNNHETQTINWTLVSPSDALDISPQSGTLAPAESALLTVTPSSQAAFLPVGTHVYELAFTDVYTTLVRSLPIHISVFTAPKTWAAPESLEVSVQQGTTQTVLLTLGNTGDAALEYRVSTRVFPVQSADSEPDSPEIVSADSSGPDAAVQSAASRAGLQRSPDYEEAAKEETSVSAAGSARSLSRSRGNPVAVADKPFAPGELIVRFAPRPDVKSRSRSEKQQLLNTVGRTEMIREYRLVPDLCLVKIPEEMTMDQAVSSFNGKEEILYAHPNYLVHADSTIPDDTHFGDLWGMHNTGQNGGAVDADIDAPEAWDLSTSSGGMIVAVIDTGVDYTHPDLSANMWRNEPEYLGTPGKDDDKNGFIDDIYGYDFVNNDGDPMDDHYHGTHCAGTIGAIGNNSKGVAGVCWDVKIMAVKFLDAYGSGYTDNAIDCIEYSVQMGAKVLSNSWGGGGYSQALQDAIDAAGQQDVLFVAAAGNSSSNNDLSPHYPSSYESDNIIAVLSTDNLDRKSSFSSYGPVSVDIGAPGSSILSCQPGEGYQYLSGTSMATPHIAGACALIWGSNPFLTYPEIQTILYESVDPVSSLSGLCASNGRLNLFGAMQIVPQPWISFDPVTGLVNPGQTCEISIRIEPESLKPGLYQMEIILHSNDLYTPRLVIPFVVEVVPDDLLIQTTEDLAFSGTSGGPIEPERYDLMLMNTGSGEIEWTVENPENWLDLDTSGGTLPAGQTAFVELALNENAYAMPWGAYTTELTFTNLTSGVSIQRQISLKLIDQDHYTEYFLSPKTNDLHHVTLTFMPNGLSSYYTLCRTPAYQYPTDISGGTVLTLADDSYQKVILDGNILTNLYGRNYPYFFVGSNGYLTFGSGDTAYTESLDGHFRFPRISALYDDLSPNAGGRVLLQQLNNRVAVTYDRVPEYQKTTTNSFQIELFFNGMIRITYLDMAARDGIAGLSAGNGLPDNFNQSDLSEYPTCIWPGDSEQDGDVDLRDLAFFASFWLESDCQSGDYPAAWCHSMDLNQSGTVDLVDFDTFSQYWCLGTYTETLRADLDDSGVVDVNDLSILTASWLFSDCSSAAGNESDWCFGADIDRNGKVNLEDLKILESRWLKEE